MRKKIFRNIGKVLLLLAFMILASIIMIRSFFDGIGKGNDILSEIEFDFHGEVIYKTTIDGGYGIIGLSLDSTSIDIPKFDPRTASEQYFCIIKNDSAEIILTSVSNFELGDYFSFYSDSNVLTVTRNDSVIFNEPPRFYSVIGKNRWLKDYHNL